MMANTARPNPAPRDFGSNFEVVQPVVRLALEADRLAPLAAPEGGRLVAVGEDSELLLQAGEDVLPSPVRVRCQQLSVRWPVTIHALDVARQWQRRADEPDVGDLEARAEKLCTA
jgi:hypothetical protein